MSSSSHDNCDISVVICTYRRFDLLARCLDALCKQTAEKSRYCVIVVDNSLQPEQSAQFQSTLPVDIDIEYIVTEKSGASYARNVGIAHCVSPYIAFLDDDAFAEPDWIAVILWAFKMHPGAGVIGGKVLPIWECPKPEWIREHFLHNLAVLDWGDAAFCFTEKYWLVSANAACRTSAVNKCGGFAEKLGRTGDLIFAHEEYALNKAIVEHGFEMWYIPEMQVRHFIQKERCSPQWHYKDRVLGTASMFIAHHSVSLNGMTLQGLSQQLLECIKSYPTTAELSFQVAKENCDELQAATMKKMHEIFASQSYLSCFGISFYPVIFIVTPCFNAVETIDQAILSVISQRGKFAIRYHVQDGGSTDGTLERLQYWFSILSDLSTEKFLISCKNIVFTYSSKKDDGMYHAVQEGFDAFSIPSNAIMSWINADDYYHQNAFALAHDIIRSDVGVRWLTGAVCNNSTVITSWCTQFPTAVIAAGCCDGIHHAHIQQEGTFFTKELWDEVNGLDLTLQLASDWDLWRRFAQNSNCYVIDYPLATFCQRDGQLSAREGGRIYNEEVDRVIPRTKRATFMSEYVESRQGVVAHSIITHGTGYSSCAQIYTIVPAMGTLHYAVIPQSETNLQKQPLPMVCSPSIPKVKRVWYDVERLHKMYVHSPRWLQKVLSGLKYGIILGVPRRWNIRCHMRIIAKSGLFFENYYRTNNPDVVQARMNPLKHFVIHGWKEGRKPNPYFDPKYYLREYTDVRNSNVNPLVHYILHGNKECRATSPNFSTDSYLKNNDDVRNSKVNPLLHFLLHGLVEGR